MKFRTQFDPYDKRVRPGLKCTDPSRTDQSQAPEADINVMLERFKVTGQIKVAAVAPTYGDYTGISDFFTGRQAIMNAEDQFMRLPPEFRQQLGNDPQRFMMYVQDPANLDSLVKRGWVTLKDPAGGIGGVAPDAKPAAQPAASAAPQSQPAST